MASIQNLILIAGPTSCGKSTLLRKLEANLLPRVASQLAFDQEMTWQHIKLTHWNLSKTPLSERVWGEYTLTRPWLKRNASGYGQDPSLKILEIAQHTRIITIWCEPAVLAQRFDQRQRGRILNSLRSGNFKSAVSTWEVWRRVRKLYKQPADLIEHYETWFKYCQAWALQAHWLLNTTTTASLHPLAVWPQLIGPAFNQTKLKAEVNY
jgi:energy-coupling factor transporter ATP-binding protein EcfA2